MDEVQRRLDTRDLAGVPSAFDEERRLVGVAPGLLFVIVICQISRPSSDWPTEYSCTRFGYRAAHILSSAFDSS